MESYSHIIFEQDGPVAIIKLNRPEVLNAFSGGMGRELSEAFKRCDADESVRVVVLTGEGRAFCSGADFSRGAQVFEAPADAGSFKSDPLDFHPWDIRKPTIAAINGHAVGLGLTLTLQCDIRLIAADAKCGIVQNRRGVFPDLRSHWALPRIVGFAKALDIMLTGRMFTGEEAAQMGLASRALPAEEVLPAALELAQDISANVAPISVGLSKRLLWSDAALSSEAVNEMERLIHLHVMGAPDAQEGPTAWVERRIPDWKLTLRDDWPAWIDGKDAEASSGIVIGSGQLATEIAAALGVADVAVQEGERSASAGQRPVSADQPSVSAGQSSVSAGQSSVSAELDQLLPQSLDLLVFVCPCPADPMPLSEMSSQAWEAQCEWVLAEAVESLKVLHAPLKTAQGQVIFVIPSFAMSGAKGFAAAAAASEGLRALAKSTAKQWGKDGMRVNTVALDPRHFVPGVVGEQLSAVMGLATSSGFGHPGDIAKDIAPVFEMLQSDDAHFLTGATLTLDGGIWMAS